MLPMKGPASPHGCAAMDEWAMSRDMRDDCGLSISHTLTRRTRFLQSGYRLRGHQTWRRARDLIRTMPGWLVCSSSNTDFLYFLGTSYHFNSPQSLTCFVDSSTAEIQGTPTAFHGVPQDSGLYRTSSSCSFIR